MVPSSVLCSSTAQDQPWCAHPAETVRLTAATAKNSLGSRWIFFTLFLSVITSRLTFLRLQDCPENVCQILGVVSNPTLTPEVEVTR